MSKILGLDLGTNSIGWALIDNEKNEIIGIGSRVFPEGVANLGEGENELSKNASRTKARGVRKQFFRRKLRKKLLLKTLAKNNLCPLESNKIKIWNSTDVFNDENLKVWLKLNPYELRAKAITQKISLNELGRVFYHMIQRRGFQSNSRSTRIDSAENSIIFKGDSKTGKIGISETNEKIGNNQTLGTYLYSIHPKENQPFETGTERIRNRYTTRQMYIDEFEAIWEKQKQFHTELTKDLKSIIGGRKKDGHQLDGILFHQRPLRSQKHLVGNCSLEPRKTKCPLSAIPFEEFRIYQWVNTVECNGEKLSDKDRAILVEQLCSKQKVRFMALRKAIKKADNSFQLNYRDDDVIIGSHTISSLSNKKYFGSKWFDLSPKEREDIWHILYSFEDQDKLTEYALSNWKFNSKQAEEISKFTLKDGYSNLSRKAINNILPFLKLGFTYDVSVVLGGVKNAFGKTWNDLEEERRSFIIDHTYDITRRNKKGGFIDDLKVFLSDEFHLSEKQLNKLYHHSTGIKAQKVLEKLPLGKEADKEIQSIKNPIVSTALFEIRKLVNEIIDDFEKPDKIKVELARDLKISKTKRNKIRLEQKRLERENNRVKIELDHLGQRHTHDNILKYKLWEECNRTCPYTGQEIGLKQLFSGEVQIEHIYPWSRSLDDSFMNKTLCFANENRAKGDKTPYEYYFLREGEQKWEEVKARALSCFKTKKGYPKAYAKFKHFIKKEHNSDFISRQLNDTRHISKEAKNYLSKICADIQVSPGQVTANLRYKWGLNGILNNENVKVRYDHRHHAIDALVVACSTVSHLQELSKWNRYERNYQLKDFPFPWKGFRQDAEKSIEQILVSHKKTDNLLTIRSSKTKKDGIEYKNLGIAARGQLHKETIFGKPKNSNHKNVFHVRKPIEDLTTLKHLDKIVDSSIRKLILNRIDELGGFDEGNKIPKDTFFATDKNGLNTPQILLPNKNGDPVPVKKVRIRENIGGAEQLKENLNQYVNPRSNHHVLIYKNEKGKLAEDIVTFWTAVERKKQKLPIIQLPPEENSSQIITTLQINDSFILGLADEDIDWKEPDKRLLSKHLYRVQKLSSKFYEFRSVSQAKLDNNYAPYYVRIQSFGDGKTGWLTFNPIKVKITPTGKIIKFQTPVML